MKTVMEHRAKSNTKFKSTTVQDKTRKGTISTSTPTVSKQLSNTMQTLHCKVNHRTRQNQRRHCLTPSINHGRDRLILKNVNLNLSTEQ